MAKIKSSEAALIFRGPPRRLQLHGELPEGNDLQLEPESKISSAFLESRHAFKLKYNRGGKLSSLKMKLGPTVLPGHYKATLKTSKGRVPVEIHVEERPRISVSPAQLSISGAAGDKVKVHVLFTNKGNVGFDIPKTDSVGIYDDDGIETAFASMYRKEENSVDKMLSHFLGKLRDGHGGLLKLRIVEGSGLLPPGGKSSVVLEAQIPSKLKAGHSYHGVWSTSFSENLITVSVKK